MREAFGPSTSSSVRLQSENQVAWKEKVGLAARDTCFDNVNLCKTTTAKFQMECKSATYRHHT